MVSDILTESPALRNLARLSIPNLDGLVSARCREFLRIARPRDTKDASLMLSLPNLALDLTSLAVVKPDPSVRADTDQSRAIRTKGISVNVVGMLLADRIVELERRSMVEDNPHVVTASGCSQGSLLSNRNGVDLLCVSHNLTNGVSAVPGNAVSVALLSIADGNNTLGIAVPGQIIDSTIDNAIVALCDSVTNTVPDSDYTAGITTSDVEARGGETGDRCVGIVFGVLSCDRGVIDRPDEDGFVRLDNETQSAFRIITIKNCYGYSFIQHK